MKHTLEAVMIWILRVAVFAWLAGMPSPALAELITVTFDLDNVWLLPDISHPSRPAQQMTGSFDWTYESGDFENGTGQFTELFTPWFNPGIENLNITIEVTSIEFSLVGKWHDLGLDMTLFLLEPLSPDQPAAIDTVRSLFEIQRGIIYRGHVISGSVVPRLEICLADLNGDGQGDLADYAFFADCVSGPGQSLAPGCEPADIDVDGDADMADFAIFQAAFGCP